MPKISTYNSAVAALEDKMVGTDANDSSITKNFTVKSIADANALLPEVLPDLTDRVLGSNLSGGAENYELGKVIDLTSTLSDNSPILTDKLFGSKAGTNRANNFTVGSILALIPNPFSLSLNATTEVVQNCIDYTTPVGISFGALQSNTDVSISALGAIVFHTTGQYFVELNLTGGMLSPSGTFSTGAIYYAVFINGVQINYTQVNRIVSHTGQTSSDMDTFSNTFLYEATASEVMEVKMVGPSTFGLSSFGTGIAFNFGQAAQIRLSKSN